MDWRLKSERYGAGYYAKLNDLLAANYWGAADQETAERMCQVMDRFQEKHLSVEDVKNFPCLDLFNINRLWLKHSQGKFGFSVQREIWEAHGRPSQNTNKKRWEKFGDALGWRSTRWRVEEVVSVEGFVNSGWIPYSQLTFSLIAPKGHLPSGRWRGREPAWGYGWSSCGGSRRLVALFSKVEFCSKFYKL